MAVSQRDLGIIQAFCDERTPAELLDQMKLEVSVRGNTVTIADRRPLWGGRPGEWTHEPVARLRYRPDDGTWLLYWVDAADRGHRYDLEPASLDRALAEIAEDPTSIFFG